MTVKVDVLHQLKWYRGYYLVFIFEGEFIF